MTSDILENYLFLFNNIHLDLVVEKRKRLLGHYQTIACRVFVGHYQTLFCILVFTIRSFSLNIHTHIMFLVFRIASSFNIMGASKGKER